MASTYDRVPNDFAGLSPVALQRLIEGEIIPRLLIAHRGLPPALLNDNVGGTAVSAGAAERFALAAIASDAYALLVEIDAEFDRGVSVDTVFLDILAPAARHLGVLWDRDEVDFVDVTMALWRLQEVVHEVGARSPGAAERRGGERRALFAAMPGEQHGFGALMVEEFFRRAGWTTASEPGAGEAELLDLVARRWFELVGLTVTCGDDMASLSRFIAALRARSRNPSIGIMVGGRVFVEHPELAGACGADATAADGKQAVAVAERLVDGFVADAVTPAVSRA